MGAALGFIFSNSRLFVLLICCILSIEVGHAQSLQLVDTVPGTIFDTDGSRVLYLFNNGTSSYPVIRNLATKAETNLSPVSGQTAQYGFLGPDNVGAAPLGGAIFVSEGQNVLFNTLTMLTSSNVAINLGVLNDLTSLRVSGNYATWSGVGATCHLPITLESLYRTDLRDGTTLALAGPCGGNALNIGSTSNDVSPDGTVAAWSTNGGTYNIVSFNGLSLQMITDLSDGTYSIYPRTDGQSYLYDREQACCSSTFSRLILNRGGIETILRNGSGSQRANPDSDYRINSGWVAFRGLDRSITLISPAGATGTVVSASDSIVYLAADGSVAFTAAGVLYISNGDVIAGTQTIVPIGAFSGAYKTGAVWYFHDSARIYTLDLTATSSASIVAAILPTARTAAIGTTVTAFATLINSGNTAGAGCFIALPASVSANFVYQTTNAQNVPVGTPNGPVGIAAGASQGFYFGITPLASLSEDIPLIFQCANSAPAPSITGLNSILITAQATQPPDLLSIAATATNDGILNIPSVTGGGAFAAAAIDIGTSGTVVFSASDSSAGQPSHGLPITTSLCRTDPNTGACLAAPSASVTIDVAQGQTLTFTIFATAQGIAIPFDPANSRIFLKANSNGVAVGQTSVAVRTL